jgi:flagellar hook-associated protein FlgK
MTPFVMARSSIILAVVLVIMSVGPAFAPPPKKVDISMLPDSDKLELAEKERTMRTWGLTTKAKISAWGAKQRKILRAYKERKMKDFAEAVRKMHCAKLKKNLIKKALFTKKEAKKTFKTRKELAAKKKAAEVAKEILSKVAERDEMRASKLLGNANVATPRPAAKDMKYWLKALRTSDPEWQRERERRMRIIQQTDPNWRSKQNNAQGDGGYSWTRKTTRFGTKYDRHTSLQLTTRNTADFSPLDESVELLQLGPPGPNAADFRQPGSEESPDEDQAAALRREAELEAWLTKEKNKITKHQDNLKTKLKKFERKSMKTISKLEAKKKHDNYCTKNRNTMGKYLADIVVNLPLPDKEKTEKEGPLLKDMEQWLKCDFCKKPKPKGKPPPAWP